MFDVANKIIIQNKKLQNLKLFLIKLFYEYKKITKNLQC